MRNLWRLIYGIACYMWYAARDAHDDWKISNQIERKWHKWYVHKET